jgi:hypothetical protein
VHSRVRKEEEVVVVDSLVKVVVLEIKFEE